MKKQIVFCSVLEFTYKIYIGKLCPDTGSRFLIPYRLYKNLYKSQYINIYLSTVSYIEFTQVIEDGTEYVRIPLL